MKYLLILLLTGCTFQLPQRVCLEKHKVVKIHESSRRDAIVELDNGLIMSHGSYVKIGKEICVKEEIK